MDRIQIIKRIQKHVIESLINPLQISPDKQKKNECKIVNTFLSISLSICFGCSNELSH